jgi:hypothetical protein
MDASVPQAERHDRNGRRASAVIERRLTSALRDTRQCRQTPASLPLPWGRSTLLGGAQRSRSSSPAGVCRRSSETPARRSKREDGKRDRSAPAAGSRRRARTPRSAQPAAGEAHLRRCGLLTCWRDVRRSLSPADRRVMSAATSARVADSVAEGSGRRRHAPRQPAEIPGTGWRKVRGRAAGPAADAWPTTAVATGATK